MAWVKWAWSTLCVVLPFSLKHLFKWALISACVYGIVAFKYPNMPYVKTTIDLFLSLDEDIKIQLGIICTMFFGFWFHHVSAVATERDKQLLSIKTELAEKISTITQKMCMISITSMLMCDDIDRLKHHLINAKDKEEGNWWTDYSYMKYCEHQRTLKSHIELMNEFFSLCRIHSSIYFQIGIDKKLECIGAIYRELSYSISILVDGSNYNEEKIRFENHMNRLFDRGVEDVHKAAKLANIQIAGLSGNITAKLISDIHRPTFRLALMLIMLPRQAVKFIKMADGPCPATQIKQIREAAESKHQQSHI